MKNHFIFSWAGNKRNEVEQIFELLSFDGIDTIIEPYMGTSAISYFISTKYPKKFKYILNDNDKNLVELYKIMTEKQKSKKLNETINVMVKKFNSMKTDETRKKYYKEIIETNDINAYLFTHKWHSIRNGLCPLIERTKELKHFDMSEYPIHSFMNSEKVSVTNDDAVGVIEKYKDSEKCLIIIDPPYIQTCNDFYADKNLNVYEWLYHNNINKWNCKPILILENIWINKLLFQENTISEPYGKTYQCSKKKTEHIIITKK